VCGDWSKASKRPNHFVDFGVYKGMARDGFEPPTQGFSVPYAKIELSFIPMIYKKYP